LVASATSRQERKEARRRRLLGAALLILSERGYNETSVDQVVAQARTSKSSFYEFFDSKEDCVHELLLWEGGSLIHTVTSAAAQGGDHRDRMRRGIRAFVRSCAEQRQLARLLLVESVGVSDRIEEVRHDLQARFAAMVEDEARSAQHDSFYTAVDPIVFGRAVVGAVHEATGHFLNRPGADPEALADGLCRIFAPEDRR
jgi:AcrR family transcriptional regulator